MPSQLLTTVLNGLKSFRKTIEHNSDYKEELADLNQLIENISAPLNIMVMGEFSTGKSTFINALLGKNVVKMAVTPTTAVITKLCYGDADTITVYFKDGTNKVCSAKEFDDLTASDGGKENSIHATIDYVERKLPIEKLKKITIIDSPGLNATRKEDEKITRQFMENADTILLLFDINKMNSKLESNLLNNLSERLKPIGIANKIDDFDEEEEDQSLEEYLAEQKQAMGDTVSSLIGVSAKQALDGQLTNNQALIKESNITAVENAINTTIVENRDKYKFYSLLDKIGEVFSEFGKAAKEIKEKNKQANDSDYAAYIQKQTDIMAVMDKLGSIAKPIYEAVQTHSDNASCKMFIGVLYYYGILLDKNPVRAFNYLEASAIKNNEIAQMILVEDFLAKENYDRVFYWAQKLTQNENAYGQYILGFCYDNGYGVEKNKAEAFKWYKKSAEQNLAIAQRQLGISYENGTIIDKNMFYAIYWYKRSANLNDAEAQYRLAKCYQNGNTNLKQALNLYKQAATQEHIKSQYELGLCYQNGIGTQKNWQEAVKWLKKSAEHNLPEAQCELSNYIKEDKQAVILLKNSAEQGYAPAQNYLGVRYDIGKGVPKDNRKSVYWYTKAAEQGYIWGQYNLAIAYDNGEGIPQDDIQAFYWYKKAADQGLAEAQNSVGICYNDGIGTNRDYDKAIKYYRKAVAQNYSWAQYNLAMYYKNNSQYSSAFSLFQKAAEQNIPNAQYELAIFYTNESKKNLLERKKAFYWFYRAAKNDIVEAQYHLGLCYERGIGTPINNSNAFFWMKKAVDNNLEKANLTLGRYYQEGIGTVKDQDKANIYLPHKPSYTQEQTKKDDEPGCLAKGCGCIFWIFIFILVALFIILKSL